MHIDLNLLWFGIVGVLLFGYAVLDGFDLGVGILFPLARGNDEKRTLMNSIGPLWDGNEVWLIVFGGALFAVFPDAYATIFSGFYIAFMLLLAALIFRAVSLEFRGKVQSARWRGFFDATFTAASLVASLLFGVATGNMLTGIKIGADKEYAGTFFDLLQPYALLIGVFVVALFAMHGSMFLHLKTEGALRARTRSWMWTSFGLFLTLFMMVTVATLAFVPNAIQNFQKYPWAWAIPFLLILAVANIPRSIYRGDAAQAFASSCATIGCLVFLLGIALFPNLVRSTPVPANSLTIYNAASSEKTMQTAAWIALCGMPVVLTYTSIVYWVFRGKVKMGEFSY